MQQDKKKKTQDIKFINQYIKDLSFENYTAQKLSFNKDYYLENWY